ncbi:O-antigen ligase family protein [Leptothoe spongobia]|uniref:O-antigen ligase family protein n=1 Tax=Leptothoe spongobia TAU-MAC 1115 TaxID=1967444 RepID=A0A947DIR7_9CYAN|nr:O-antigen ligase family protein [Leptothoe spongobia]MBT9317205.1 O-antigen ligase family protein [Leptothoe spongobia TAU-MAC 1115]
MTFKYSTLSVTSYIVVLGGVVLAALMGWGAGISFAIPLVMAIALLGLLMLGIKFEYTVLGLLCFRSAIDIFSEQQLPAIFAVGLDLLAMSYIALLLATRQKIHTNRFFWFFASWVLFQGLWVGLLPMGGLGMGTGHTMTALREWIRLFSWLMVYLLVMQLQDKVHPKTVVKGLLFSLILPLFAALLQICLPASALPTFLAPRGMAFTALENASRVNGTLGHPNTLVTFLVLFLGVLYWQMTQAKRSWPWLIPMGIVVFFIVATKALVGLVMTGILIIAVIIPRITVSKFIGATILMAMIVALFGSTEFGRERLLLFATLPFFNDDLDLSRAILLRGLTSNSFYWRLEQWTLLLDAWQQEYWLGYGLGASKFLTHFRSEPHNDYVRALVEGGVVGIISYLTFLGGIAIHLIQTCRSHLSTRVQVDLALMLLATLIAMMVGMLTENIWSHTVLFFYWFTLIALCSWDWRKPERLEHQPQGENSYV